MLNINFDTFQGEKSLLSVILDADSFFYAVIESDTHRMLSFGNIPLDGGADQALKSIAGKYNPENVFFATKTQFFHLGQSVDVQSKELGFEAQNSTFKHISFEILSRFSNYNWRHFSTCLSASFKNLEEGIYLFKGETSIDVAIQLGGVMQFFNRYKCMMAEDVLYYIRLVIEKSGLPLDGKPIYLGGLIDQESSIHYLMKNYVEQVKFMNKPAYALPSSVFHPSHYFIDHLINIECAS